MTAILEALMHFVARAVRALWDVLRGTLRGVRRAGRWWWDTFLDNPLAGLVVLLFALTFGTLGFAWAVRVALPERAILVDPFEVPSGTSASLAVTGRAIARGLADDLQAIMREAGDVAQAGFSGSPAGPGSSEIQVPPADISTVGVKVAWFRFSTDGILAGWEQFRRRVWRIEGEAILESDGLTLRGRAGDAGRWESARRSLSKPGLDSATFDLASQALARLQPQVMGNYYWGREQYEKANDVFRAWVDREPSLIEPRFHLAVSLQLSGRPREAIREYRKALERDTVAILLLNLGSAYAEVGDYPSAEEAFRLALARDPDELETDLILQNADDLERRRQAGGRRGQAIVIDTAAALPTMDP